MAFDTEVTPKSHPKLSALRQTLKALGYHSAAEVVKVPEAQAAQALKQWHALAQQAAQRHQSAVPTVH